MKVTLKTSDVIRAVGAVAQEAARRGEMYPQTSDEQQVDKMASRRVVEMLLWYEQNTGCANLPNWPVAVDVGLTFREFRAANLTRCVKWHPQGIESWSESDWMTALMGEVGELASLVKMINRERDGLPGNKFHPTKEMLAKEAADVQTYLDLFCASLKIDLGRATAEKFNEVSDRVGFPDRIEL